MAISRRQFLSLLGLGAGAVALGAQAAVVKKALPLPKIPALGSATPGLILTLEPGTASAQAIAACAAAKVPGVQFVSAQDVARRPLLWGMALEAGLGLGCLYTGKPAAGSTELSEKDFRDQLKDFQEKVLNNMGLAAWLKVNSFRFTDTDHGGKNAETFERIVADEYSLTLLTPDLTPAMAKKKGSAQAAIDALEEKISHFKQDLCVIRITCNAQGVAMLEELLDRTPVGRFEPLTSASVV